MALVQTRQLPDDSKFSQVGSLVRALRGAAADELSAANLYSEIVERLSDGEIKARIKEILTDEEMHLGSLMWCIEKLDKSIAEAMAKGAEGK